MVLHPRHKLQYFKKAGWEETWIKTSHDIVRTEFDQTYAFMDAEEQSDVPPPTVCIIYYFILYLMLIFSLLPLTIFLTICQHFLPLQNPISAMNSIVISAPTPSMLLTQSLGGTRNGMFILASIAWHWTTSLFRVSFIKISSNFSSQ